MFILAITVPVHNKSKFKNIRLSIYFKQRKEILRLYYHNINNYSDLTYLLK